MLDIRYVAGFFDGDGSIGIYFRKVITGRRGGYYDLNVTATQKYGIVVSNLQEQFGGYLYNSSGNIMAWRITGDQALAFLVKIEPYLIVKRNQALLAIDFQRRRQLRKDTKGRAITDEEFEYEKAISNILKELKR